MYFYIEQSPEGVEIYIMSPEPLTGENFVEITKEEYYDKMGIKEEVPKKEVSPEIKALSDRQDFLEDCVAEMAQIVYS